jgi:hypothetical protein
VVVGPRAYEAHPELVASNARLLEFARRGGTLLVLGGTAATYGYGVFPFPLGPSPDGATDRVTMENAPVTVSSPAPRLLAWPNRINKVDWGGWVSERASFMPRVIDPRYATPLEMHDPDQPEGRGALLVAPLGRGMYIYTTLALVQQLPAGVTGAARLFVNLMASAELGRTQARANHHVGRPLCGVDGIGCVSLTQGPALAHVRSIKNRCLWAQWSSPGRSRRSLPGQSGKETLLNKTAVNTVEDCGS